MRQMEKNKNINNNNSNNSSNSLVFGRWTAADKKISSEISWYRNSWLKVTENDSEHFISEKITQPT